MIKYAYDDNFKHCTQHLNLISVSIIFKIIDIKRLNFDKLKPHRKTQTQIQLPFMN